MIRSIIVTYVFFMFSDYVLILSHLYILYYLLDEILNYAISTNNFYRRLEIY